VSGIGVLVDELCAALVAFEPARRSGADCADLAERLARGAKACDAASARAAARAVECGAHRERGDATAPEWLARVSGSSAGAARVALETVNQLEACPATKEAVAAGAVSLGAGDGDHLGARPRSGAVGACTRVRVAGREGPSPQATAGGHRSRRAPCQAARSPGVRALEGRDRDDPLPGRAPTDQRRRVREPPRHRNRPLLARGAAREAAPSPAPRSPPTRSSK